MRRPLIVERATSTALTHSFLIKAKEVSPEARPNIMKIYYRFLLPLVVFLIVGCSKEEPTNPDNGDPINPDTEVADPIGTIELAMRNKDNGDTWLDNLHILSDNNFYCSGSSEIASIGPVAGLGNVSSIPLNGWTDKAAVNPSSGYVVYNDCNDEFTRLYVTSWTDAVSGGIIGARVKYQKPFKGLDEEIKCCDQVVLPAEGGQQEVIFENTSIIPFKVSSSEEWCRVEKASTRDRYFLYDAIVVECDESYASKSETATITIETLFGKKKEITVTRAPRAAYITLSQNSLIQNWEDYIKSIDIFTNVDKNDINITSSADWLSAIVSDYNPVYDRPIRSIGKRPISRSEINNTSSKHLIISFGLNNSKDPRSGTLTLASGDVKVKLHLSQDGCTFHLNNNKFEFDADAEKSKTITLSGVTFWEDLSVVSSEADATWASASIDGSYNYKYVRVQVEPNYKEESRTAHFKIMYKRGTTDYEIESFDVVQKGIPVLNQSVFFEKNASNQSIAFSVADDAKLTSSASWCSASKNGDYIVVRAVATTVDRKAEISISGSSSKIYVSQSKYGVGDEYSENGLKGTVYSMQNGVGKIVSDFLESAPWSKEKVDLQGAKSSSDGEANTNAIHAIPGWEELYPAFAKVDELNVNGISGWYMPAVDEYKENGLYWYSTQCTSKHAYAHDSYHGYNKVDKPKDDSYKTIGMHKFSYDFFTK